MLSPSGSLEWMAEAISPDRELDILIIGRRALWRHALAGALAAAWTDATFRDLDGRAVDAASALGDPTAVLLLGGPGLAENDPLCQDLASVTTALPATPVLVLTDCVDAADVASAITGGARGYLASDAALPVLIQSLRLLMMGGTAFPGIAPAELPGSTSARPTPPATANGGNGAMTLVELFTLREREVLSGLGEGKPNKIIAYDLGICETTVKVHMRQIMRKLGATNRTHAALLASEMLLSVG